MDKRQKGLLIGVIGLIVLITLLDATAEEPVDWTPTYVHTDNRALGTEVFYDGLTSISEQVKHIDESPFTVFQDSSEFNGTYFFLSNYVNLTKEESIDLLNWAEAGETVFIASQGLERTLLDSLNLDISFYVSNNRIEYQPSFNLLESHLALDSAKTSRQAFEFLYFSEMDSTTTRALGKASAYKNLAENDSTYYNFAQVKWGKGQFLIHLAPQVFTNYFMVDGNNHQYTSRTLGYLDLNKPIYWDNYYKPGKEQITNPLYYLLTNKHLKAAYYMVIIASLFYVFFGGKRKQKPIPVIAPLKNRSFEFTQTIAGMFLEKKDHKAIAYKQIQSFLAKIRSVYHLSTEHIDDKFIEELSLKTSRDKDELKTLFKYIEHLNLSNQISSEELKTLDQKITHFNI